MTGLSTRLSSPGTTRPHPAGRLFRSLAAFARHLAARAAEGLSRRAINERVLYQLGGMSDRELRDIGLVRQDVVDAATFAQEQDSTLLLVARRNERRGAGRS